MGKFRDCGWHTTETRPRTGFEESVPSREKEVEGELRRKPRETRGVEGTQSGSRRGRD